MTQVAVVGAGNMGAGIAQCFAAAGFTVRLHDTSPEAIARGIDRVRIPLEKRVAEGKMEAAALAALLARLTPAPDLAEAVAGAELVVEAIFEDLTVKRDLFAKLGALAPASALLATNTSSLYVKDLAAVTSHPERVVGLHFFFPAAVNRLVEVVQAESTSEASVELATKFVKRAGKTAIRTADAPGFCVNRFFVPWVNEACRLLGEGVSIPTIEAAAKDAFGIAMGPFELMNVTGVPVSLHAQSTLHRELGAFYEPASRLVQQVQKKANWDVAGVPDAQGKEAVAARLRGVVFAIACQLVDDGVADRRDTDRGATIGLRWALGPFAMMNQRGLPAARNEVEALTRTWGKALPMPKSLAKQSASWTLPAVGVERLDGGQVAILTLDRPEALNALSPALLADLEGALASLDPPPRALVVTGEGRTFAAGADIPTMRRAGVADAQAYTALGLRVLGRLSDLPCPVIMAVNGPALGGGLELALAGDVLYGCERTQLALPEVGLGIHPGFGGTQRLPRRVGVGRAKDMVFTGRTVGAQEALSMGLLDGVVPAGELVEHCVALARRIAKQAPLAVAGAKRSIDQGLAGSLSAGLAIERESVVLLFSTRDKEEGLAAFAERRPPLFVGA
ncbi:MAG: 3-hydroxyacyl-CoA dehydrogenase/enoyl-CoA hydratase family protein [Thermoplasmatota archaeon]